MATKKFRILTYSIFILLIIILPLFIIGSVYLFIFKKISLLFLILFIPLWYVSIKLEKEFIWVLIHISRKEPYNYLSKISNNHEDILNNYLGNQQNEIK